MMMRIIIIIIITITLIMITYDNDISSADNHNKIPKAMIAITFVIITLF